MTGIRGKLYEEGYKGRLIEREEFCQSVPGAVAASHFTISVELPSTLDARSDQPSNPSTYAKAAITLEQSASRSQSALAAATVKLKQETKRPCTGPSVLLNSIDSGLGCKGRQRKGCGEGV